MYGQIYIIENIINKKTYIGQTIRENAIDRYNGTLENTKNLHLKYSINKYGLDNFTIKTLCWFETKEELNKAEICYIEKYDSTNDKFGYNKHKGGIGGKQSDEALEKISKAMKKNLKEHPELWKKRIEGLQGDNNPMHRKGGHTKESREKMSNSKKKLFKEGKLSISRSAIEKSHTLESREKRKVSASKVWHIQYDLELNEVIKFHTLHDLYDYMVEEKLETKRKTYGGFKNLSTKQEVFSENGYNGYYYKMLNKSEYVNPEVNE